jgi:hypothetical protein
MILKSIGKALRDVGIVVGSVAAVAGLAAAQDPEVLLPLYGLGPYGPIIALAVSIAAKTGQDYIKHRGDSSEEP